MTLAAASASALSGLGARRLAESQLRIVVTGAGGWLGLATLELLHGALGAAFAERVVCFGSNTRMLKLRGGIDVPQLGLDRMAELPRRPSLVLHLAFLTKDRAAMMPRAEYVAANREISRLTLDCLDRIGTRAVFTPSSGAAYSADDQAAPEAMRLYGRLKRDDEIAFGQWARAAGAPAVIVRVFNLSGPYINKVQSYALAAFIIDALAGRPIEIKARRPVYRSYVSIGELMSIVFGLLTEPTPGPLVFDTAGERALEMQEIAEAVRTALGRNEPILRPEPQDQTPDVYVGDGRLYAQLRQSQGVQTIDFPDQIRDTAAFLAEDPAEYQADRGEGDGVNRLGGQA